MKRTLLVALLICCTLAQSAAASFPGSYENLAERYWHARPACASIAYVWVDVLEGYPRDAVAAAEQPGCTMWIVTGFWFESSKTDRCTVFLHEWGHLIGKGHTRNRHATMHPLLVHTPKTCLRRGWKRIP